MSKAIVSPEGRATKVTVERIPVTLLTGFLGSGKTTILNYLLSHPQMSGAAVLINEFGEVGIDHHLVQNLDEATVILDSGCICCSVRGDLVRELRRLAERVSKREIPPVTRVVIETTGLADPVPIVQTLTQERFVSARFLLESVVTVVDAVYAADQIDCQREAVRQIAMADQLLITKTDRATSDVQEQLRSRLAALNPSAVQRSVRNGLVEPELLFSAGIYSPRNKLPDVVEWLGPNVGAEQYQVLPGEARGRSVVRRVVNTAGHHQSGDHDPSIRSFVVRMAESVPWEPFAISTGRILERIGEKLLRLKGIIAVSGDDLPWVIHCVHEAVYPPVRLGSWPDRGAFADRSGRIVFITKDLTDEEQEFVVDELSNIRRVPGRARAGGARLLLPTRCWLDHANIPRGATSAIEHDGWVIQPRTFARVQSPPR